MLYADWLDQWIKGLGLFHAERTQESYVAIIQNYIKPRLGGYRLKDINEMHLLNYYISLEGLAASTIKVHQAVIDRSFRDAVGRRLLYRSPSDVGRFHQGGLGELSAFQSRSWCRKAKDLFLK